MNKNRLLMGNLGRLAGVALALVAGNASAAVVSRYNLPPPVTGLAHEMFELHNFMLIICSAISTPTARGSRWVPPAPGSKPILTSGKASDASAVAIR